MQTALLQHGLLTSCAVVALLRCPGPPPTHPTPPPARQPLDSLLPPFPPCCDHSMARLYDADGKVLEVSTSTAIRDAAADLAERSI